MAIVVRIPTPLQKFTTQQGDVETTGTTIHDMLEERGRPFPGLRAQRCDEWGAMRKCMHLSLNHEDIRCMAGEKTVVTNGDEVASIPAVAGGVSVHQGMTASGGPFVSARALALAQAAAHERAALSEAVDPGSRSASALRAHAPSAHALSRATHGEVPRGAETASHGVVGPAHVNKERHDDASSAGNAEPGARTAPWRSPL